MALKTFNIEEDVYNKFSAICKRLGVSMSKQVELFMRSQVEENPEARADYLERLDTIRKGKFIRVSSFKERYKL